MRHKKSERERAFRLHSSVGLQFQDILFVLTAKDLEKKGQKATAKKKKKEDDDENKK